MYFTFECPSCSKKLKVQEEAAGRKAGCPYCKASITVPSPPSESAQDELMESLKGIGQSQQAARVGAKPGRTPPAVEAKRKSSGSSWADRTDVNIVKSGLLGLAISAGFLLAVAPFAIAKLYFGALFYERGWVPFVLVFFMGWAVSILILKSRKLKTHKASMLFDLLPNDLSEDINTDSVGKFVEHIHALPVEPGESFLVNRVLRGLEHFGVRKSNPEVASMLASHSEIDANAVQSSYTLLNVFIWAIPILGFIGTVIGIGQAVGGFSGSLGEAESVSVLRDSLNDVTSGLATAFDTTLVALVMSLLVMFPTSSMQKAEEDLLNGVDEYCNENLLKRLDDGGDLTDVGDTTKIRDAFNAALAPHHAELRTWGEKLQSIGSTLTAQVVEGWGQINRQVESRQTESLEQMKDLDTMAAAFLRTMSILAEQTGVVHQQAAGSMRQAADLVNTYCSSLKQGITGLNDVLGRLGEKQVVVQAPRRRGWFFRRNSKD